MQDTLSEAREHAEEAPRSVCDLIDDWARRQPDHPAILSGSRTVSYQQLNDAASRLARLLIAKGVQPGDIIPVLATRTCDMVVSFLAVLKTGACYVPIDVDAWGQDRIKRTLERVSAHIVINLGAPSFPDYDIVSRHDVEGALEDGPAKDGSVSQLPQSNIRPTDLVYIVFTSGTTSEPKGVMIPHRALLNYVTQGDDEAPFNTLARPEDKSLLTFSPGFDAGTGIIFSTLCNGAQLIVVETADFESWATKATIIATTPSMLSAIRNVAACSQVRTLIIGGEPPHTQLIRKWTLPSRTIYNGYGPTETTVGSLMGKVDYAKPITLGRPMSNGRVILLDGDTPSDYGEICLTGPGLATGYYKDETLTAQKFVHWQGERMYRTGDFARMTEHGLEYAGRADSFVKNRGLLLNIDSQVIPLLLQGEAQMATAFMFRDYLVAFITPETIDTRAFRARLSKDHDAFLVPDTIRAMPFLPLTPNGKADNRALRLLLEAEHPENNKNIDLDLRGQTKLTMLKRAISAAILDKASDIPDDSSFFDLGGNSLAALKVISYLRDNHLKLGIRDLFNLPSLAAVSAAIEDQSKEGAGGPAVQSDHDSTVREDGMMVGPMTFLQARMIQATLKTPGANTMLLRIHIPYRGTRLDTVGLQEAWRKVLQKHAIFRTQFDLKSDLQYADASKLTLNWSEEVISAFQLNETVRNKSLEIRAAMLETRAQDERFTPVNLFRLVTVPDVESVLLFSAHHAQADGWSLSIILDEVQALLEGDESLFQKMSPDFLSIAIAQRSELMNVEGSQFWTTILDTCSDIPKLALPKPPSNQRVYEWSKSLSLGLNIALPDMEMAARRLRVTSSTLIYVAWGLVMSNYTSSDRVAFGAVFSGRNLAGVDGVDSTVGPLLSTVPFPITFDQHRLADVVSRVNSQLLQMVELQWSAFDIMAKTTGEKINAALQTLVVTEYDVPPLSHSTWVVDREDLMEFGLTLLIERSSTDGHSYSLSETDKDLQARILFDSSRYAESSISRLVSHFRNALLALVSPEDPSLQDVREKIMDKHERQSLLKAPKAFDEASDIELNQKESPLKDAFERGVSTWPDACAVEGPRGVRYTYREVDDKANIVANSLATLLPERSSKGTVIGVLSDGSPYWVISLLAVLKAGCICCPIDISLPPRRIEAIIEQSGASVLVYPTATCAKQVDARGKARVVADQCLDKAVDHVEQSPTVTESIDVAFLIFTSGTTGVPKGVPLHHLSILNFLKTPEARLFARPGRRISQLCALGFDMCLVEFFASLLHGGTLVLKDQNDPFGHLKHVDAIVSTPSLLSVLSPHDYENLDTVLMAGEPVPQTLAETWASRVPNLFNFYGPSECGCVSSGSRLLPDRKVNIGRPIAGMSIYILDHRKCLVPQGIIGEIYITGVQITRGYWNASQGETESKFIKNPFSEGVHDRVMYRTGDLALWDSDMNISYVGRIDNMVKVRGFRVELGEVESAIIIAGGGQVKNAAAIVVGGGEHDDDVRIVGVVTPANADLASIRLSLMALLPHYARPSQLIAMTELPRTANLKIDRQKLETAVRNSESQSTSLVVITREDNIGESDLSTTEQLIAETWKTLLRLPEHVRLRKTDDFTALGGNSVMSIKMARTILSEIPQASAPMALFIRETNLESLAKAVDRLTTPSPSASSQTETFSSYLSSTQRQQGSHFIAAANPLPLSHLEDEMLQAYEASKVKSPFNTVAAFIVTGVIDTDKLAAAFTAIILHNPVLRSRYVSSEKRRVRAVARQPTPPLLFVDNQLDSGKLQALVDEPFDLRKDQLIRVVLWEKNGPEKQLKVVVITHHIVTDKASLSLLLQWVSRKYAEPIAPTRLSTQNDAPGVRAEYDTTEYLEWAQWLSLQTRVPSSSQKLRRLGFWRDHLHGVQSIAQLHVPGRIDITGCPGATRSFKVKHTKERVNRYSQRIAVAATGLALSEVFGTQDLILGIPFINRDDPLAADIIGLFLDRLPLRIRLDGDLSRGDADSVTRLLETVTKETTLCLDNHLPYTEIQKAVKAGKPEDETRQALIDVMIVYDWHSDSLEHSLSLGADVRVTPLPEAGGLRPTGSLFPLVFGFIEGEDGGLSVHITYNTEIVSSEMVDVLADKLLATLTRSESSDVLVEGRETS